MILATCLLILRLHTGEVAELVTSKVECDRADMVTSRGNPIRITVRGEDVLVPPWNVVRVDQVEAEKRDK